MKTSKIFHTNKYRVIQKKIVNLLNSQAEFLSPRTINSPRAVGDAIENIFVESFQGILGPLAKEYSSSFARRAMADLAFTDNDDCYYVVDVKTHRLDTKFNMPNLTSVERLTRFYEDDSNYFVVLLVDYEILGSRVNVAKAIFVPIEFLAWDCLTLGALGWGQIQIAKAGVVKVTPGSSRKTWMLDLCDHLLEFYPREIGKIKERMDYFRKVRRYWVKKER